MDRVRRQTAESGLNQSLGGDSEDCANPSREAMTPAPKRRWFRFWLRTLFVAVTVAPYWLRSMTQGAEPKDNPQADLSQGIACLESRDYDTAVEHFSEAIRLNPKNAEAYNFRGVAWKYKGQFDNMIRDCTEAIRIDPNFAVAFHNRGRAWRGKKEYDKAIQDFTQATSADPLYGGAYNSLAWLRATLPDAKYRNGQQAVEFATKACELAGWKNGEWLSTLAAAYAELGNFEKAVIWQTRALELASADEAEALKSQLKLYQGRRPYRQMNP
jgi:tetratricopeptide (TPR) repeat protein